MVTNPKTDVSVGVYQYDAHDTNDEHVTKPEISRSRRAAETAVTPNYVLIHETRCFGPQVAPLTSGVVCSSIYGFSDKKHYDQFCTRSELALTPYPLVKCYLRDQIGEPGDALKLVVLEAAGPEEPCLHAATVETVLDAHESRAALVTTAYRLVFDREIGAYRVEVDSDVEREQLDDTHV
jgi:hypothetical protein